MPPQDRYGAEKWLLNQGFLPNGRGHGLATLRYCADLVCPDQYVVLAPWVVHSTYSYMTKDESERDLSYFLILPLLLSRMVHNQIWISLSRYRTAKGDNRIVDKSIEFEQVDRERNWDDQIILNGFFFYLGSRHIEAAHHLPWWRTDGVIWTFLFHAGPVEFIYYWFHRALHHHFLYSRYHSHHHSSIVTEPITSVIHPFAEHIGYYLIFSLPVLLTLWMGNTSILSIAIYLTYIDFMNNMGHCNFEHIPKRLFSLFPPLKYLIYTPSYHSLHHTQFRTNYSLFMPFYDYVYGTMDKSSDSLYEKSLVREAEAPDVVHLTHLTTPESIYHLRLGFAFLASEPQKYKWYLWLMWPVTLWSMMITWIYGRTFTVERNVFKHLKLQTWAIPKFTIQYQMQWQRESINSMIEDSVLEAEVKGVRVLTLGLLNQDEGLNGNGELFLRKHPKLKLKLVDGSSLAVAVVLNSIPKGTTQVLLRGKLSKIANSIALALCQGESRTAGTIMQTFPNCAVLCFKEVTLAMLSELSIAGTHNTLPDMISYVALGNHGSIVERLNLENPSPTGIPDLLHKCIVDSKVYTTSEDEYEKLKAKLSNEAGNNLVLSKHSAPKTWLVGDDLSEDEQIKASKGTTFIPFSRFPPKKTRKDCVYLSTPAMLAPKHLENVDSCENWLPRRVMSAWRIAGILHAMEEWNVHECGNMMFDIEKIWQASLAHGFRPLTNVTAPKPN
ncbi:UNVERIFIED_CONTAM: Very-long-chain aldehyde decarbonylase CER1 [Sesamum angustifolium]|uniref:Very-long-chain aldehyde decarbonylase CER1 n=1 Tax=Sesamum angustifolium TaxID=2727405 RepID=A0AAW2N845_9LAMI